MDSQDTTIPLRVEVRDGSIFNEYRIRGGRLELRSVAGSSHQSRTATDWRGLDDNDIDLHRALGTVVSKWLPMRLAMSGDAQRRSDDDTATAVFNWACANASRV